MALLTNLSKKYIQQIANGTKDETWLKPHKFIGGMCNCKDNLKYFDNCQSNAPQSPLKRSKSRFNKR